MLRQIREIHQRNWNILDLKKATLVIASWRMVQGFYVIFEGMTLLHFHEEKWPDEKQPLLGGELFPNMDAMGTGYVTFGCVEVAINIGLFFNTEKSKPMIKWPILSIACTGFYTYLLIYQFVQYEIHKSSASPFAEFVLFVLPLLGEGLLHLPSYVDSFHDEAFSLKTKGHHHPTSILTSNGYMYLLLLHWFAIHIVRCFFKDMEYNYDKYREVPIRPFKGIVFYKVDR